jgi:ribosomal protein S18 acetylase RimI-like enzyme
MSDDAPELCPAERVRLKDGRFVTIRSFAPADGAALGEFYESIPRSDERFYCPHPLTREKAAEEAAQAAGPRFVGVVAEAEDGRIAGYAWYRWKADESPASGFGICVRPEYQGAGAGRALMARLLAVARRFGPPVMGLTVQVANGRAVALYRSMGFRVVREQVRPAFDGFPAEAEYRMELRVR